jgi:hypothetical protein
MTRRSLALLTTLFATMACGTSQVQASFVSWSYNWTPSALALPADVPGSGGLSLTNEPTKNADGTSDVVVTNIRGFSSASRSAPDKFTRAAYTFTLVLTDLASGQSAHMAFSGFFSGTMSATSANIANTFTGVTSASAVTLGGHVYTVTMGNYSPPGPPTASNAGSISAHVGVDETPNQPPPEPPPAGQAPEPSTLLLSCLGLSGLGMAGWRKWRARARLDQAFC